MPTPFERRDADSSTRHHLLFEKPQWHARPFSHRVSTLGAYTVGLARAPHDYLHQVIKPLKVPEKKVCDMSYDIGKEYSKVRDDETRIGQIVEELTFEAETNRSPERAHQFFELAASLSAQMAVKEYFEGR